MKSFIIFLGRLPEYPKSHIHDIQVDMNCLKELNRIYDEKETLDKIIQIIREDVPTECDGGGKIAGSVPVAGDDKPVKKRKRYIYQKRCT